MSERSETGNDFPSGDNEVHEHVLLDGRVEYLSTPMEHYAFPDIASFIEKHERYSWDGAGTKALAKKYRDASTIPPRPAIPLPLHLEARFRDGYRGLVLCRLLAGYERMIVSKECEMKKRTGNSTAAL